MQLLLFETTRLSSGWLLASWDDDLMMTQSSSNITSIQISRGFSNIVYPCVSRKKPKISVERISTVSKTKRTIRKVQRYTKIRNLHQKSDKLSAPNWSLSSHFQGATVMKGSIPVSKHRLKRIGTRTNEDLLAEHSKVGMRGWGANGFQKADANLSCLWMLKPGVIMINYVIFGSVKSHSVSRS